MDRETLYCPNRQGRYDGKSSKQGRLVKNGTSHGQKQALCKGCGSSVSLRYGTAYYDLNADPLIAQGVKRREKGRVVEVTTNIVFGQPDEIEAHLTTSMTRHAVNTSFVERENLTLRQRNRRLTPKTNGFSKELSWFEKQ
jgi:hypothetical protein